MITFHTVKTSYIRAIVVNVMIAKLFEKFSHFVVRKIYHFLDKEPVTSLYPEPVPSVDLCYKVRTKYVSILA